MTALANRTTQKPESLYILQSIADKDKTADKERIAAYNDLIYALAGKLTASTEEAEAATREIFKDIWQYSKHNYQAPTLEDDLNSLIAFRRLIKFLQ